MRRIGQGAVDTAHALCLALGHMTLAMLRAFSFLAFALYP